MLVTAVPGLAVAALAAVSLAAGEAAAQSASRKQTTVVYTTLTAGDIDALLTEQGFVMEADQERRTMNQVNDWLNGIRTGK